MSLFGTKRPKTIKVDIPLQSSPLPNIYLEPQETVSHLCPVTITFLVSSIICATSFSSLFSLVPPKTR